MKVDDLRDDAKALVGIEAKTGYYPGMAPFDLLKGTEGRRNRRRILGRKGLESHCYHLMSRTCGGEVWFDDTEKEALMRLILKMSRFCGVEVLTFCVMGNHFHVLARVPDKAEWLQQFDGEAGERALLTHLGRFYSRSFMDALRFQLGEDRRKGNERSAQGRLQGFKDRLCDVSVFMRELKLRFSKWYNKRHGRRGTLWMDRFKSVLVEGRARGARGGGQREVDQVDALRTMALYIDLNPVRAGLVGDPAKYRWCGYAVAIDGNRGLREGLLEVTRQRSWLKAKAVYGAWLGEVVDAESSTEAAPENEKTAEAAVEAARLGMKELLRHRVRYFSDGGVIGSREFVREHRQRDDQDKRRVPSISELKSIERLHCLRQLQNDAVSKR